jgi:membrane-bound lytic murein transglycosylase B
MSTEPAAPRVHPVLPWLALAGLLVLVAGLGLSVLFLFRTATAAATAPVGIGSAPAAAPSPAAVPVSTGISQWAQRISQRTGIPVPAVTAYGAAQLSLRASDPGCHLAWNTLAGIATVESGNGGYGGARLTADGEETVPIIGIRLDGAPGVRTVPDTDRGALDGDPDYDRAVGPFQFLPATWKRYAGTGDPQNIGVAALAAGRYLCGGGRDLATATGWWSAVLAYNNSTDYADHVLRLASAYAAQS